MVRLTLSWPKWVRKIRERKGVLSTWADWGGGVSDVEFCDASIVNIKNQKIRQRHVKLDLYNACILFIHPHMMFAMCPMLLLNTFIGWSVFRLKVTPLGCQLIDSMTLTPVVFESCWNEKTHKHHTVDGWNLANHLACKKSVVNNGIFNYQSQLVCSPDWNAINRYQQYI